jgi:hypothetical protein
MRLRVVLDNEFHCNDLRVGGFQALLGVIYRLGTGASVRVCACVDVCATKFVCVCVCVCVFVRVRDA